jgi:hypothetical protein
LQQKIAAKGGDSDSFDQLGHGRIIVFTVPYLGVVDHWMIVVV